MEKLTHYAKDKNFILIGDLNATQFDTSAEKFFDKLDKRDCTFQKPI